MRYLNRLSHTVLYVALFLSAAIVHAQADFAPPGAQWCLRGYDFDDTPLGYGLITYERDSVVGGRTLKVLSVRIRSSTPRGLRENYTSPNELMYQSRDSVFYYIPNIGVDVFIYKMKYQLGEETTSYLYNDDFDVLAVEERVIDGEPLHVAEINLQPWLNRDLPVTMYDSWGPSRGFISSWGFKEEGKGYEDLEAVRSADTEEVRIVDNSQCFALMDAPIVDVRVELPLEDCKVTPYPNPLVRRNRLYLKLDCNREVAGTFEVQIFSVDGKKMGLPQTLEGLPGIMDVEKLKNGRYFGVLKGPDARFEFSFLVQR